MLIKTGSIWEYLFGWVWPGMPLVQSNYRILSVHQHLWEESVGRQHLGLSLLFGCGHQCLPSNQIPEFFDQQYLWKELIVILDFMRGDIESRKVSCETASFFWVRPGLFLKQFSSKNPSILKSTKIFVESICKTFGFLTFAEGIG